MNELVLIAYVAVRAAKVNLVHRLARDERGEGVISMAIAVLIMAFLGALMWVGFKTIWGNAESNTNNQVNQIGK
jgi:hypothetical protein